MSRIEHDLLGDREVPDDVYYGVHTVRAMENFVITGIPISRYPELIVALACVKEAAARANHRLGLLEGCGSSDDMSVRSSCHGSGSSDLTQVRCAMR